MAERRILTCKVTSNDNFVALPATAQALYMHLTMTADDDGFCSQISTAMFRSHAKQKDLEALVNARYLLRFENGVIVIKHWYMANTKRSDRYAPTVYQEEYSRLTLKGNKAYTLVPDGETSGNQMEPEDYERDNQPEPEWHQDGTRMAPERQPSGTVLEPQKKRKEKKRKEDNSVCDIRARVREREDEKDDGFQAFWAAYPKKNGGDIREAFLEYEHVTESLGVAKETLVKAAEDLAEATEPEEIRYLPNAAKWLRNRGWESKVAKKTANKNAPVGTVRPTKIDMGQLAKVQELIGSGGGP